MSFIDLDRKLAFVRVAKTSSVVESYWRAREGRVLYCAAHDSASYLSQRFPALWNPCVKVGFVRNPWALMLSFYHWYGFDGGDHAYMRAEKNGPFYDTFADFMLHHDEWFPFLPTVSQWPMLCDGGGTLLIDRVCRTENLQSEFDWICDRAQMPRDTLPVKQSRSIYSDYYNDETRAIVARLTERDIGMFGYTFQQGVA
jgi:hypothetical protein